jgi:hypothetical protein
MQIDYSEDGIYLPEIKLWLDAHRPRPGEAGFVSHAHMDHAKWHGLTIASSPTLRFMRGRNTEGKPCDIKNAAFMSRFRHEGALCTHDEGAGGAADLHPAAAQERDHEAGHHRRVQPLRRVHAGGDTERDRQR